MDKQILLIEDENMISEMYELVLSQSGYHVDIAADADEALARIADTSKNYDLVLLDVMIPKMDGLTLLKKMKTEGSHIKNVPVFLLTNLGHEDLIKEALETGAIKYFIKSNYLPKQIVDEVDTFFANQGTQ